MKYIDIRGARTHNLCNLDLSLPRDKLIVTYCNCGPGDADSANVAEQFLELGFSNVKVLADPSIRGWKQAGYPLE